MEGKGRGVAVAALALVVVHVLADPVAAQGYDTVTEQLIDELNANLLAIAIPVTVVVEGILLYTVWRFRKNDEPEPTRENRELEITWTVATAIILLFVGVASYSVMADEFVATTPDQIDEPVENATVVEVTGFQWFWQFAYPQQNVSGVSDEMVVPANRTLVIRVQSNDVIHAFHVPEMGLKSDALPGQQNVIRTRATATGNYTLFCAEYCGVGHSEMLANVTVVEPDRFQSWLDAQRDQEDQQRRSRHDGVEARVPPAAPASTALPAT